MGQVKLSFNRKRVQSSIQAIATAELRDGNETSTEKQETGVETSESDTEVLSEADVDTVEDGTAAYFPLNFHAEAFGETLSDEGEIVSMGDTPTTSRVVHKTTSDFLKKLVEDDLVSECRHAEMGME